MAFCAACASVMLPPGPDTRSFATVYCSGLPPDTQLHGRFCPVLPHVTTTFSHGTPSMSAATRCVSVNDSVPRLPIPDWMYIRPSGLTTKRPSNPTDPETNTLDET